MSKSEEVHQFWISIIRKLSLNKLILIVNSNEKRMFGVGALNDKKKSRVAALVVYICNQSKS